MPELVGSGNGLFIGGTTSSIGGGSFGLVGSTTSHMSLLFLAYLAAELV